MAKKKIKDLSAKELKSICIKQRCCPTCPLVMGDYYECVINYVLNKRKFEEIEGIIGIKINLASKKEINKKFNEEIEVED